MATDNKNTNTGKPSWLRQHWVSFVFLILSTILIYLSTTSLNGALPFQWFFLVLTVGYIVIQAFMTRARLQLKFDRAMTQGTASQLWSVVIIFVLVFDCLMIIHSSPLQLITDMIGPERVFEDTYHPEEAKETVSTWKIYLDIFTFTIGLIVFVGMLVATINRMFDIRAEKYRTGQARYKHKNNKQQHVVIIGSNTMIHDIVRQLLIENNQRQVLVMTNGDVEDFRNQLISKIGDEERHVVIYYGESTSKEDLKQLDLEHASRIYVIGDAFDNDQSRSNFDVKNMECVKLMAELLRSQKSKIVCRVLLEYQSTLSVFKFTDIHPEIADVIDFRPFNFYETWARKVLVCPEIKPQPYQVNYLPLEGVQPITYDSHDTVHLIVFGMSRMGIGLAMQAAQVAHYPNFQRDNTRRTRITFIDSDAKIKTQHLMGHYKELFALSRWRYIEADNSFLYYGKDTRWDEFRWNDPLQDPESRSPYKDQGNYTLGYPVVDIDWEFIQGDMQSESIHDFIRNAVNKERHTRVTIAVCLTQDNATFATSLYLPDEVYDNSRDNVVQVLAYQPHGDALCNSFQTCSSDQKALSYNMFAKLRPFGMIDRCYDVEMQKDTEESATILNKVYNEYYSQQHQQQESSQTNHTLYRKSLAANQWSTLYAAAHLWTKLRSIGWTHGELSEKDKNILAGLEHNRWSMEQLLLGYSPLLPEEQAQFLKKEKNSYEFIEYKNWLKANMSHPDICTLQRLQEIDPNANKLDWEMVSIIDRIYERIISN